MTGVYLAGGLITTPLRVSARETGPGIRAGGAVHCSTVDDTTTAFTLTTVAMPPNDDDDDDDDEEGDDDDDDDEAVAVEELDPLLIGAVGPNTQARLASFAGKPEPRIETMVPPSTEPVEG